MARRSESAPTRSYAALRRGAGADERGGLENRCPAKPGPWVRIPPPPLEAYRFGAPTPQRPGELQGEWAVTAIFRFCPLPDSVNFTHAELFV
jgi:hypothetical protein